MKLSSATLDKIENALKHYQKYRPAFGRTAIEQMDLDDKHRLELYSALDELRALRMSYGYGDLFGLEQLMPKEGEPLTDDEAQALADYGDEIAQLPHYD